MESVGGRAHPTTTSSFHSTSTFSVWIWVYVQCSRTTYICRQINTCHELTFTSFSVVSRLSRHIVVAPIPVAPLLTDIRRSAVGSGTREDIVAMPDELRVHDAFHVRDLHRARHVRDVPWWFVRML